MSSHINSAFSIPAALAAARRRRGWSQARLGREVGLPQMHISAIETGKVAPRLDTLLDISRALEFDLLLVPRELVPLVQSQVRALLSGEADDHPLYTPDEEDAG